MELMAKMYIVGKINEWIRKRILEEEMKGAANLAVELEVDMHQGNNWYEAKQNQSYVWNRIEEENSLHLIITR